jgi:HEAT repeat protein
VRGSFHRNLVHRRRLQLLSLLITAFLGGCDLFQSLTPDKALQLMNSPNPDARRDGIAAMVTRFEPGKTPVLQARYRNMAQHDNDVAVRAMAIRALNICMDKSATPIFVAGLSDQDESVRLESAKALANLPDRAAIPALIERLNGTHPVVDQGTPVAGNETRDVRIAAADALRFYKDLDVEHALVDALNQPEFGISWQAHQSLIVMTGKDLAYNQNAWLQLIIRPV